MKTLYILVLFVAICLSSCNNNKSNQSDKSNIIINVNMMGEKSDSIQNIIDKNLKNDSTKVININIYNNYSLNPSSESIEIATKSNEQMVDTIRAKSSNDIDSRQTKETRNGGYTLTFRKGC